MFLRQIDCYYKYGLQEDSGTNRIPTLTLTL